jgi:uncharacterized protein YuzE
VRALHIGLLLLIWSASSWAKPTPQIIQSCLRSESIAGTRYIEINPGSFNEEDDEAGKTTFTTITLGGKVFGIWEATDSNRFGLIDAGRKIPIKRVVPLGTQVPSPFNPYTAQWGESATRETHICA